MGLRRNLATGLVSSLWTTLIGLAVVPLYLRYLGIEAYGLIGFFLTLQALLQLLDVGMAPTVNREVARSASGGHIEQAAPLLHSLASIAWGVALLAGSLIALAAPTLADHWLQAHTLSRDTLVASIRLMGLAVACRWPVGLYLGALMGAERQPLANGLSMGAAALGHLGAVAALALVSPTPQAFFLWHALTSLALALAMRAAAWSVVGRPAGLRFSMAEVRRVWRFSAGLGAVALTALVFTQLDKALLSRLLGLEEFGRYMLATAVAGGLYLLVQPLFQVVYPRFSALAAGGDQQALSRLYRGTTQLLGIGLFPAALLLAVSGGDIVALWTGDGSLALLVAPVLAALAAGTALHGVMHLPYALQLAHGMPQLPLEINGLLLVVQVPLTIILARSLGSLGGGLAWLALNSLYLLAGAFLTHRHLLPGLAPAWLAVDVGVPAAVSLAVGAATRAAMAGMPGPPAARLALGAAGAAAAAALTWAASPRLRLALRVGATGWQAQPPAAPRRPRSE